MPQPHTFQRGPKTRTDRLVDVGLVVTFVVIGVLGIMLVGGGCGARPQPPIPSPVAAPEQATTPAPPPTVRLGKPAPAGPFDVTVTEVDCGADTWGTQRAPADQHWCVLQLSVKNISTDPAPFRPEYLTVVSRDEDGRETTREAAMPEYREGDPFLESLQPGDVRRGQAAATVPTTERLVALNLVQVGVSDEVVSRVDLTS